MYFLLPLCCNRKLINHQFTWIFVILGNTYDIKLRQWRADGDALINAQEFWFALGMTVFVLIPWFTVREVPVDVEIVCYTYYMTLTFANVCVLLAITKGCSRPLRPWYAARSPRKDQPFFDIGVSRFRNYQ